MAKKKTTKKRTTKKTAARKSTKKPSVARSRRATTPEPDIVRLPVSGSEAGMRALWRKVKAIAKAMPKPPQTGIHRSQGDEYPYTRFEEIADTYNRLMDEHNLLFVPGCCSLREGEHFRGMATVQEWVVIDVDTNAQYRFEIPGMGNNGVWASTSSSTVSKKQAMLLFFQASWRSEFDVYLEMTEALMPDIFNATGPQQIKDLIYAAFQRMHEEMQKAQGRK